MNDEAARPGRPDNAQLSRSEVSSAAGREPSVEEIVRRCRQVAARTGFAWIHDLAIAELERCWRRVA